MSKKNIVIALTCLGAYQGTPLTDIKEVDPTIQVEMRYATSNNFTGHLLTGYTANKCFLLPETAEKLHKVQSDLRQQGLGLKVYDCYRPVSASEDMVQWTRETNNSHLLGEYIASRSGHNKGNVVDLTLINLRTEQEPDLGKYDEFSSAAWTTNGANEAQRANRQLLKSAMQERGLINYSKEWWHFSDNSTNATERYTVPIK